MNKRCLHSAGSARQKGFTLVMGMIMLVLLTLMAVAAFHLGANQTIIVANAQHKNEGVDAAQQAIDTVINSSNFTQNPAAAIAIGNCSDGGANKMCVDSNGDGANDFTVTLTPAPACVAAAPIPAANLDFAKADDLACATETQQAFGVSGATVTGDSLCANSTWEVNAQAVDSATNTAVNVTQGVAVRIAATDMTTNCP
ncbi:MAG: hypothetical protein H6R07_133 [Proteobacteria bacterium]|nr:hypothetical protein [Pseudomonadota bacterium]